MISITPTTYSGKTCREKEIVDFGWTNYSQTFQFCIWVCCQIELNYYFKIILLDVYIINYFFSFGSIQIFCKGTERNSFQLFVYFINPMGGIKCSLMMLIIIVAFNMPISLEIKHFGQIKLKKKMGDHLCSAFSCFVN